MRASKPWKVNLAFCFSLIFVRGNVNDIKQSSEHSLGLTQSLNLARQKNIQETCARFPPKQSLDELPASQLDHILVDDVHKLLYCYVPKVACTNWKRILLILTGKWNNTDVLSITGKLAQMRVLFKNMSSVSREERAHTLDTYHKMIIVRNPFERLLSAYRDKFEGADNEHFHVSL